MSAGEFRLVVSYFNYILLKQREEFLTFAARSRIPLRFINLYNLKTLYKTSRLFAYLYTKPYTNDIEQQKH